MTDSATLEPLHIIYMVEPSPLTYICGYTNRFQALWSYLHRKRTEDTVDIVTTEAVVQDPPHRYLDYDIYYAPGFSLPHYPSVTLSWPFRSPLRRLLMQRTEKQALVHVSSPGIFLLEALWVTRWQGVPILLSYHTHLPVYARTYLPWWLALPVEWLIWKGIRWLSWADLIVVTSPQVRDDFRSYADLDQVMVWPKGIDTERFHPRYASQEMRRRMMNNFKEDHVLLLYVGRLALEKRLKDLRPVVEALPHARLCFVGTGPQEDALKAYFAGTRTVFLGQLTGRDLSQAYASADIFVMPSDSETLGFCVMESMASGVPVVACNAGGIPDMIFDGETGYLVLVADTAAYVDRIERLTDEHVRQAMGAKARAATQAWSWDASMETLRKKLYPRAIENIRLRNSLR